MTVLLAICSYLSAVCMMAGFIFPSIILAFLCIVPFFVIPGKFEEEENLLDFKDTVIQLNIREIQTLKRIIKDYKEHGKKELH